MMQQHSNLDTSGGEELPQISCRPVWSIFIQNNHNKHHIACPPGLGMECLHWYRNIILMKFSFLAAPEVFIFTTSSGVSDENWHQDDIYISVFCELKMVCTPSLQLSCLLFYIKPLKINDTLMRGYCTGLLFFSEQLDILEIINLGLYFPIALNFDRQLNMTASHNSIWKAENEVLQF